MKKVIKHILPLAAAALLTACSSTDYEPETPSPGTETESAVSVQLKVATQSSSTSRSDQSKYTPNQDDGMYSWVILLFDSNGTLSTAVYCSSVDDSNRYEDSITSASISIATGTYTAYTFANINPTTFGTCSTTTISGNYYTLNYTSAPTMATLDAMTYTVNGNGYAYNSSTAPGVPMSNKETVKIVVDSSDTTKGVLEVYCPYLNSNTGDTSDHLHVTRMYAYVELQIQNHTNHSSLNVESVSINHVTANGQAIPLMPTKLNTTNDGVCKTDFSSLTSTPETTEVTTELSSNNTIAQETNVGTWNDSSTNTLTVGFYVNESATPSSEWGLFEVSVKVSDPTTGEEMDHRYTLVTTSGEEDDWSYIARNDYRIIPLMITEYSLTILVEDYPAIGVYPASVVDEDGTWTATFHDGGHFHLMVYATSISGTVYEVYSTSETTDAASTTTSPANPYLEYLYASSEYSVLTEDTSTGTYYMSDTATATSEQVFYYTSTDTTDASENGGIPVWDSSTSWSLDGTSHSGLFFGKFKNTVWGKAAYKLSVAIDTDTTGTTPAYKVLSAKILLLIHPYDLTSYF